MTGTLKWLTIHCVKSKNPVKSYQKTNLMRLVKNKKNVQNIRYYLEAGASGNLNIDPRFLRPPGTDF